MNGTHTKVEWYEECTLHPLPADDDGEAWGKWDEQHFFVGEDCDVAVCEETKLGDACRECTAALIEERQDDREFVPWHGDGS